MGRALRIFGIVVLVVALAFAAMGWHYSNQILGPDDPPARSGEEVLDFTDSTVTFAPSFKTRRPGRWALEWDGGWAELGPMIDSSAGRITRSIRPIAGSLMNGPARVAGFAQDAEPHGWLGLDFETIGIPARVGALPAWKIDGADSSWVILLHGRGATRAELLRMLPAYVGLGLPCLVIGYRGDPGGPHAPGGGYRMGWTEWLDLEDAVRYAIAEGARDIVLVGCSMGGGIVTQFLRHSRFRDRVRAAVLDAPTLDWNAVLAKAAEKRRVPAMLTEAGKFITTLRTGIRWDDLDQARFAREFSMPMLIVHGQADQTVPIAVSRRFAAALPGRATLVEFAGADHVESSNFDEPRYQRVVRSWLRGRGVGSRARVGSQEPR